jgi:hypothetical protein
MSSHERTICCGLLDPEISLDDLPEQARHLAGYLRRAYTDGVGIDEIWEESNAQLSALYETRR